MVYSTTSGVRYPLGSRWLGSARVTAIDAQGDHVVFPRFQTIDRVVSCTATDASTPIQARPNTRSATGAEDFPGDVYLATLSGSTDAWLTVIGR